MPLKGDQRKKMIKLGLGPPFRVSSSFRAPHCAFCTFRCGLLFVRRYFLCSSFVPLPGVFPLFIYLFIYKDIQELPQWHVGPHMLL